jgi:hypothetical protein
MRNGEGRSAHQAMEAEHIERPPVLSEPEVRPGMRRERGAEDGERFVARLLMHDTSVDYAKK